MLIFKVESSSSMIREIIQEMLDFSKANNVMVESDVNKSTISVAPWDDFYDILEKYNGGYFHNE